MHRRFYLIDPQLFALKVGAVIVVTAALVPLVYYQLYLQSRLYLIALLLLHVMFLYIYLARVQWRLLLADRTGFVVRVAAVIFFVWLLAAVIKFQGNFGIVLLNMVGALLIHILILLSLMLQAETL